MGRWYDEDWPLVKDHFACRVMPERHKVADRRMAVRQHPIRDAVRVQHHGLVSEVARIPELFKCLLNTEQFGDLRAKGH
jgi:hypothetical protein